MTRRLQQLLLSAVMMGASLLCATDLLAGSSSSGGRRFVAPGKLFGVKLPGQWTVHLHEKDPYTYEFRPPDPKADAFLIIRRIQVPAGANPRQLRLQALEKRLSKLPHFKVLQEGDAKVASFPAASLTATFAYQGNLQFPRAVEELYVVTRGEAFIFHFECFQPYAAKLSNDINYFYKTFRPRPRRSVTRPQAPPPSTTINTDKVPF